MNAVETISRSPRRAWLAMLGLLLTLSGPAVYALLLENALFRRTGLAAWILMAAGALCGLIAAGRDRRIVVRAVGILPTILLACGVYMFFVVAALPQATTLQTMDRIPDFTMPDHTGQPVTLSDELSAGPVMLVFYRGHW